ncbi:CD209 antigen-like protein, partial [Brachionus plicatilis]
MLCPEDFTFEQNKCVYFSNQTVDSWHQARNECQLLDSDLLIVKSRVIVDELNTLLFERNLTEKYWIGAQALDENAFWTDRSIILSNGPWWNKQALLAGSNESCLYAQGLGIDSVECDEPGVYYICERDSHLEERSQVERSPMECSKSLRFGNKIDVYSSPSLPDYKHLDPNYGSRGAYFRSSWANITFQSHAYTFGLNEINVTKAPARAIFVVRIFVGNKIVETISGEGFTFNLFFNFRVNSTGKFQIEIKNIDEEPIEELKVFINGCLRRGPMLQGYNIHRCASPVLLSNLKNVKITTYNYLNDLSLLINPHGMGCSYENDEAQIEIDLTRMPIDQIVSVLITKDYNKALIYVISYYKGEKVDVQKAFGMSTIEISALAHYPTDKIVVIIRNINGALVQNVKISLMVCLIDYEPPTIAPDVPVPFTCDKKIEISQYSSQVQIFSNPAIDSIHNIFLLNGHGCSFRSHQATIIFDLSTIHINRLYSLKIFKNPYLTQVKVETFYTQSIKETINRSGRSRIEICDFGDYKADKVVIQIFQLSGNVLENVKINLVVCVPDFPIVTTRPMTTNRKCVYEQIFTSDNPWFDLTSVPYNPQLWDIMFDRIGICNFDSNQALITVLFNFDIINQLILVRVTKDPNSALVKLVAYYKGLEVYEKNGLGSSLVELSAFPDMRIDRIEIKILNQNRYNVENVKLYIKVCTDTPNIPTVPTTRITTTTPTTTTVSSTRPPLIICASGAVINFSRLRPDVRLLSSPNVTNIFEIYPDAGVQGVNFFGENPNVVFNLLNEVSTQVYSIKITKYSTKSLVTLTTYYKDFPIDTKNGLAYDSIEFFNFRQANVDKISVIISTENSEPSLNVKIDINSCLKPIDPEPTTYSPGTTRDPTCEDFASIGPSERYFVISTSPAVSDSNNIFEASSSGGLSFTEKSVNISFQVDSMIRNLVTFSISKNPSLTTVSLILSRNNFVVEKRTRVMGETIIFSELSDKKIDRIRLLVNDDVGRNVRNLRVSINGCLETQIPPTRPLSTTTASSQNCQFFVDLDKYGFLNASSIPSVANIDDIFQGSTTPGLLFNSSLAHISFNVKKEISKIESIRVSKDSSTSTVTVLLERNSLIVDSKTSISYGMTQFDNFSEEFVEKVNLIIENLDNSNIRNLKVAIRGCLEVVSTSYTTPVVTTTTPTTTPVPIVCESGRLMEFNPLNPKVTINTIPIVQDVLNIYPQIGENGVTFRNKLANIAITLEEKISTQIYSVKVTKDNSRASFTLTTFNDEQTVNMFTQTGTSEVNFFNFLKKDVNKLTVIVFAENANRIENLKISIRSCLSDAATTPKITTTTSPTRPVCFPSIDFAYLNPMLDIRSDNAVTDINRIYEDYDPQGVDFNSNVVKVEFKMPSGFLAQIVTILVTKKSDSSTVTIILISDGVVDTKTLQGSDEFNFSNFLSSAIKKLVIIIKNEREAFVKNVKVKISACVENEQTTKRITTTTTSKITTPIRIQCEEGSVVDFKFDNPKVIVNTEPKVDNFLNLYPELSQFGGIFDNNIANIAFTLVEKISTQISSITITKDNTKTRFLVTTYLQEKVVETTSQSGTNIAVFSNFNKRMVDKIAIILLVEDAIKITDVKINIKSCLKEFTTTKMTTSTTTSTTTKIKTSPKPIVCERGPIKEFTKNEPEIKIYTNPKVNDVFEIYHGTNGNGVEFEGNIANIAFSLEEEISTQIYSVEVIKDISKTRFLLTTFLGEIIINTFIEIGTNKAAFYNFDKKNVDRIVVILLNIDNDNNDHTNYNYNNIQAN